MPGRADFVNREASLVSGEPVDWSFGTNWQKYLGAVTPERLEQARASLSTSFAGASFRGESFLDIGCGSGLFSMSAAVMGAASVVSIDVDPSSVACAERLRAGMADVRWECLLGSVLDEAFVSTIPKASRVYSWGVLHHTGNMWKALRRVTELVADNGLLCVALYSTPNRPAMQMTLKRMYNRTPRRLRWLTRAFYGTAKLGFLTVARHENPYAYVRDYGKRNRGMSYWRDVEDWLGGLPFQYAEVDAVTSFVAPLGFEVCGAVAASAGGCHEYLFRRTATHSYPS